MKVIQIAFLIIIFGQNSIFLAQGVSVPAYFLDSATNSVRVLRAGANKEIRAIWINFLYPGDQLRIPTGGNAIIVSPSLERINYTAGNHTIPTPPKSLIYKGVPIGELRNPSSFNEPNIIFPRMTLLSNKRPTFKWRKVNGASKYSVTLYLGNKQLWTKQGIIETQLSYPTDLPPLTVGEKYTIEVEASLEKNKNNLSNSKSTTTFKVLNLPRELETSFESIKNKEISEEGEIFLFAKILSGYREEIGQRIGFFTESIEKLENSGIYLKSSQACLLLSNLYLATGLPEEAKIYTERGLELAKSTKNYEQTAWLLRERSRIAIIQGKSNLARRHLSDSLRAFQQTGNVLEADKVKKELTCIIKNIECIDFP
jgi:tetratricopeptide (TPR) repeat protein